MEHTINPRLINMLEGRVLELEAIEPGTFKGPALATHNQRLRNARMSLARARGSHTEAEWQALVAECNHDCVRCGRHHHEPAMPVKAHIVPFVAGGSDAIENIMPVCRQCASARRGEMIDWLAAYRETHTKAAEEGA